MFPGAFDSDFADRHERFWQHVWSIENGVRPRPYVAIWPRGGGKTTGGEVATIMLGARGVRRYAWYIQETQDQSDKRVVNIAARLESQEIAEKYPKMSEREIGKFGQSRGWRRNFVRTASGFIVEAVGLDKAARSSKVGDARPDILIIDDIDGQHDTLKTVRKKIETLTKTLLPAATHDAVVVFVQNLIHPDSIASQLVDGRADFLLDRIVDGPHPAIIGLEYEQRHDEVAERKRYFIIGGIATWEGQSIEKCQDAIDKEGLTSFLQESQHEVEITGGIWDHVEFERCDWHDTPDLVRGAVWVDPAVTSTDNSDSMGIIAGGIAADDKIYKMYFWEDITTPEDALRRAILKAIELGFDRVGVETDQGGDVWRPAYKSVCDDLRAEFPAFADDMVFPTFDQAKAGAGHGSKAHRNSLMLADYDRGMVIHVQGTHTAYERALRRFPKKPLDLADAGYWLWYDLSNEPTSWDTVAELGKVEDYQSKWK